jgi:hypothetical protein
MFTSPLEETDRVKVRPYIPPKRKGLIRIAVDIPTRFLAFISDIHTGQRKVGEEPDGQCPTEQEVWDVTAAHPESGAQLEQVRAAPI